MASPIAALKECAPAVGWARPCTLCLCLLAGLQPAGYHTPHAAKCAGQLDTDCACVHTAGQQVLLRWGWEDPKWNWEAVLQSALTSSVFQ